MTPERNQRSLSGTVITKSQFVSPHINSLLDELIHPIIQDSCEESITSNSLSRTGSVHLCVNEKHPITTQ